MDKPTQHTILRVEADKRHFTVQRPIAGGIINEEPEVMVPASILNSILRAMPANPSYSIEQAFIDLRRIMDTKI